MSVTSKIFKQVNDFEFEYINLWGELGVPQKVQFALLDLGSNL